MAETVERKPFKSIHIDTEKGIYLLNGEEVPMVSRIDLEFNNGKWSLLITRDELYVQEATKGERQCRDITSIILQERQEVRLRERKRFE